jgi:tetratricopeptide (TPR) repeat protein
MRGRFVAGLAVLLAGCTTPVQEGERLYREGDRLAALETWRSVPEGSDDYASARDHIAALEPEFERLVVQYEQRADENERQGDLAEAILDYRLALALQPDPETLDHVQQLARTLASRRAELEHRYAEAFEAGDLAAARRSLDQLRSLDPFDASLETDARKLDEALQAAVARGMEEGRSAFAAGRHHAAARSFRAVLDLDPGNEAARGYLSYIATMRREREAAAAIADADAFASDAEMRAEGFHQRALAAEHRGDPYAAIRYELRAIETAPDHSAARRHLAALRQRMSGEVQALVEAGRIAFREEDLESALDLWRRALLVDPDNERVLAYIGRVSQQIENLERLRAAPDANGS